jgi:hypothetical protein
LILSSQHCLPWPAGLPDFSWYNIPKWGKVCQVATKLPNCHNIYQITIICRYIQNGQRIYKLFSWHGPPKFTQIWIFGLKTCHLATLSPCCRLLLLHNKAILWRWLAISAATSRSRLCFEKSCQKRVGHRNLKSRSLKVKKDKC